MRTDGYSLECRQYRYVGKRELGSVLGSFEFGPTLHQEQYLEGRYHSQRLQLSCPTGDASGERLGAKLGAVVAIDSDNWFLEIGKGIILMRN